jgi:hypothetical protein
VLVVKRRHLVAQLELMGHARTVAAASATIQSASAQRMAMAAVQSQLLGE